MIHKWLLIALLVSKTVLAQQNVRQQEFQFQVNNQT